MQHNSISNIAAVQSFILKNKNALFISARLIIAAGLLTYIILTLKISSITSAVEDANLNLILAAFLLGFVNLYTQYWKWKTVCRVLLKETGRKKIWRSIFIGFSAGIFTPVRVGEYFGRGLALKDKPLILVTAATIVDKFSALLLVAFIGSLSSLAFIHIYNGLSIYVTVSLFIIIFTLFYFLTLFIFNEKFWNNFLFEYIRKYKKGRVYLRKLEIVKKLNKKIALKVGFISFLFFSCYVLQFGLLMLAFSAGAKFLHSLWGGVLMIFTKTVIPSISFGDLGIREGASVYFLTELGEAGSAAFNASIFLFLINVLLPALTGLFFLLKKNDN